MRIFLGLIIAVAALPLASPTRAAEERSTELVQVGTYDYLTQPDFTGIAHVGDVARNRTMGIGTFANLDGELVMIGGTVYQVRPDGVPRPAEASLQTPFMQAVKFRPDVSSPVPPGTTCANLPTVIEQAASKANGIIAVRVRGTFTDLVTRSVTADPPPFQPLSQTIAEQTVFPLGEQRAVLVGFWQGSEARGIGQNGLHLHGLTADRRAGGHVLSCTVGSDVQLSVQSVASVRVLTP